MNDSVPSSSGQRLQRLTLFGDLPLEAYPPIPSEAQTEEPWPLFVRAREALSAGRKPESVDLWHQVIAIEGLESRHYAQAWHFLRKQGVTPPPNVAKALLGVIVEVPMSGGLDLVAAYASRHARYFNFSGQGIIWERPDDTLDPPIDTLLAAGARILQAIGPWSGKRPPAPPAGQIRVNLLSPAGLHFCQGAMRAIASDSLTKPAFDSATALMQKLINAGQGHVGVD